MSLTKLGWNPAREEQFAPHRAKGLVPARVAVEDKHYYRVWTADAELLAQITGKIIHEAKGNHAKLPKVGDWVAVKILPNEEKAAIHAVLPRTTQITRKNSGRETSSQVLAANLETIFLVLAADISYNAARLERMLVMAHDSGARPVVVLNKMDLCETPDALLAEAQRIAKMVSVFAVSAATGRGVKKLAAEIKAGDTVAFIGTSGVGKSSLINQMYGDELMPTIEVREQDAKGRHTTTWREMIFLPKGGVVIDTPGMREFHLWDLAGPGTREAFPEFDELALRCHFRDCTHTQEKDCAVLAELNAGKIPRDRYESFVKLQKELAYLREAEKRAGWTNRRKSDRVAHRAFNKEVTHHKSHR
jgi:ribosome biogenesis GTPase / thiamine phosphate phosphatase